jgi:hypothetical protein
LPIFLGRLDGLALTDGSTRGKAATRDRTSTRGWASPGQRFRPASGFARAAVSPGRRLRWAAASPGGETLPEVA